MPILHKEITIKFHTAQTCLTLSHIQKLDYVGLFEVVDQKPTSYPVHSDDGILLATVTVNPI